MLIIQSVISIGESAKSLLVPQNTTTLFSDRGIDRFMSLQSTFSARSSPIPKFNVFNGVKYLCHDLKYLRRPAIIESPNHKMFVN